MNEDRGFNRFGSELLDFCKQTGMRILNGRTGVDGDIGKCTYVCGAGRNLVDYVIASPHIFSLVDTFNVDDPNILSDHCIVIFSLCLHGNNASSDSDPGITSSLPYKYVWNYEYVEAFQNALDSESVRSDLRKLRNDLLTENVDINENVGLFQDTAETICAPLFKKNISSKNNNDSLVVESNQPWFNEDCKFKRNVFYKSLSVYRANKQNDVCRENMVQARSDYKKVLRKSRYDFRKTETQKLEKARYENAENYWKLLKNLCPSNSPRKLTSQHFADYLRAINNLDSTFFKHMMIFCFIMRDM